MFFRYGIYVSDTYRISFSSRDDAFRCVRLLRDLFDQYGGKEVPAVSLRDLCLNEEIFVNEETKQ